MSGCATAARYPRLEPIGAGCLVDHPTAAPMTGLEGVHSFGDVEEALYVRGRRVPNDDLAFATRDDARAHDLAVRSRRDEKLGVAGLVVGGAVAGTGAALIGWGIDQDRNAGLGSGAALAAVGAGVVVGTIVLIHHAEHERERAIIAYNQDAPPSCR